MIGRRPPPDIPGFGQMLNKAGRGLSTEAQAELRRVGMLLEEHLRVSQHASYNGLPAEHGHTHAPGGADALDGGSEAMAMLAIQRADESGL